MQAMHPDRPTDPRSVPAYTVAEAVALVRVPVSTLQTWIHGEKPSSRGLLVLPRSRPRLLAFSNLVEAFVLPPSAGGTGLCSECARPSDSSNERSTSNALSFMPSSRRTASTCSSSSGASSSTPRRRPSRRARRPSRRASNGLTGIATASLCAYSRLSAAQQSGSRRASSSTPNAASGVRPSPAPAFASRSWWAGIELANRPLISPPTAVYRSI